MERRLHETAVIEQESLRILYVTHPKNVVTKKMNRFKQRFWSDKLIFSRNIKMTPVKTFNKTVELSAEGIQSRQDECAMR